MNKIDLVSLFKELKHTIYEAGAFAVSSQSEAQNIGKKVESLVNDSEYIAKQRAAKTIIDEKVQEMLLQAVIKVINPKELYLDAEEKTPSVKYFSPTPTLYTLVIDPIEGTIEYITGKDSYSICIGVVHKGSVIVSLVLFPKRDELYVLEDGKVYLHAKGTTQEIITPEMIEDKKVYINNRVSAEIRECLQKNGYTIQDDTDGVEIWTDALIKCMKGQYTACIFHTPQVRDILIGAMMSYLTHGYSKDWLGNNITWPNGGRVPTIIFGFTKVPSDIASCLLK